MSIEIEQFSFIYLLKEKENRKAEVPLNSHHLPSTSTATGSLPKRYQSVFTEGTPLTSFGVRNDDNHPRTHSVGFPSMIFQWDNQKVIF